jgi:two-component system sensor histidine kinase PilS (NtrC family)
VATPPLRLAPATLLRWIYLGRLALVSGMLAGAFLVWGEARPEQTFLATLMFVVGLTSVAASLWWTEIARKAPVRTFLVAQVALDALLVTGVVHITGGGDSTFAWLYILVISEGALLLPLAGGLLLALLASILYFADIIWGHSETLSGAVGLQIGVFVVVALATGVLGDRLRRAGMKLGEMESELRRLRLDTAEILATISTGVLTVDERGRLLYLNPAGEALLGLDRTELEEAAGALAGIAGVAPQLAEILARALEERTAHSRLRSESVRDGEPVVLGVSTFLREEEGDPLAVTAIFQDITDLEQMAILNRRAERLEAVAELSASLAHEIKNPLASIRSAVEQFASPRLEERDRALLTRMVVRESDRLSRLLTDFLDFSRSRVERMETVRLDEVVRDAVTVIRQHPVVEERGIVVELELDETQIMASEDLVHRAILNLLLNAAQYSPDEGRIEVTLGPAARAPAGVQLKNPVHLQIRDHGPGVPPEALERIFDPFYTTREGGSGLGLAVVYRMVETHGGVILAENAQGGGAAMQLYFPGLESPEAADPDPFPEPASEEAEEVAG